MLNQLNTGLIIHPSKIELIQVQALTHNRFYGRGKCRSGKLFKVMEGPVGQKLVGQATIGKKT